MSSLEQVLLDASRALLIGAGGGGDVVGALATARFCQCFGIETALGGVSWERLPVDPRPGPRRLDEIDNIRELDHYTAMANAATTGRGGFSFSESHMASYLGSEVLLVDVNGGPKQTAKSLVKAASSMEVDLVVMVDVGGDVLADGSEPGLASPLCDSVMLAAAADLSAQVETVLAVFGLGCDGELTHDELLQRIAQAASVGCYLGAWSLTPAVCDELDKVIETVPTEASAQAIHCARGQTGETAIRQGQRKVTLSPIGALTAFFEPVTLVHEVCPLARAVADSGSLEEANSILNEMGIETELDYELRHSDQ